MDDRIDYGEEWWNVIVQAVTDLARVVPKLQHTGHFVAPPSPPKVTSAGSLWVMAGISIGVLAVIAVGIFLLLNGGDDNNPTPKGEVLGRSLLPRRHPAEHNLPPKNLSLNGNIHNFSGCRSHPFSVQ
jgi:hypothetical protein